MLFVGLIGSQFIDLPTLSPDWFSSKLIFDSAITIDMNFIDGGNLRPLVNRVLITGVLALGYLTGFTYIIRNILRNVKEDKVFIEQNSQFIKYLGYSLIVFSAVMSISKFWIASAISNVITIPTAHFGANFSLDFQTIFIGLVIVLLSQIFAYGTHLQNEYDATI